MRKVKNWQEYEKMTGLTLANGCREVFGKIKPDDKLYTIEYVQKVFGKGRIPARIVATSIKEAKDMLPDKVAYATDINGKELMPGAMGRIIRSKIISIEPAMTSKHVGDWYKGCIK